MVSICTKREFCWSVAGLICLAWASGPAWAQFRDLDAPTPSDDSSELIDLIPTDQEFLAPIVDADQVKKPTEAKVKPTPAPEKPSVDKPKSEAVKKSTLYEGIASKWGRKIGYPRAACNPEGKCFIVDGEGAVLDIICTTTHCTPIH